ncbi:hypothetical protein M758_12G082400 [Ceratodon purpureus]|nr:hypothetical protein M758_12G082400 [Ceratodon purpureus]
MRLVHGRGSRRYGGRRRSSICGYGARGVYLRWDSSSEFMWRCSFGLGHATGGSHAAQLWPTTQSAIPVRFLPDSSPYYPLKRFPVGNAEYVKQFLLQYSLLRRKEGFVLRHDSLASGGLGMGMSSERVMGGSAGCQPKQMGHMVLPDVLCTSSDFSNSGCAYGKAGLGQNKMHRSGSIDSTDNADVTVGPAKPPKSNAAAQRERTGKLKMTDLAQHFHLPINAAAKELGICPTVLKKICRRNGMRRWPHRKIKSIERIIATLEQTIAEGAGQGDEGIRMEIAMLRNERAQLCAGFLGDT